MTGTDRRAGKHERIKRNMDKSKQHYYFHLSVLSVENTEKKILLQFKIMVFYFNIL